MKKKIKWIGFGMILSYLVIISSLTLFTLGNVVEEIDLHSNENYQDNIQTIKNEIRQLDSGDCRDEIENLLKITEHTIFQKEINLRELYQILQKEGSMISGYIRVKNACAFGDDVQTELNPYILNSTLGYESMIQKYLFQYALFLCHVYE